jgi:glycosyltransferase involved in cell wall biosynthesis
MPSIHAIRWIENLKDSTHELYWFDILSKGAIDIAGIHQLTNWNKRKISYIKGEYFLSKKTPFIYKAIQPFLEVTIAEAFEQIIAKVKPDVVHSFEMQSCSYPLLPVMKKYPQIKWVYSCWGSDLFYYKQIKRERQQIKKVLNRVNYLHTDCARDFELAKQLGFKGTPVGVIPGGGGFKLNEFEPFKKPLNERKIILVKGYEHTFGRGLNVVKALQLLVTKLQDVEIVVFGAHENVINYIQENNLPFKYYSRQELLNIDILKLMGASFIYIGNSISDGMPNTLLEAIIMGAFPIQSNPGGATEEIITHNKNGFIISNPNDVFEIKLLIERAINNKELIKSAYFENKQIAKIQLNYDVNRNKIINLYKHVNL